MGNKCCGSTGDVSDSVMSKPKKPTAKPSVAKELPPPLESEYQEQAWAIKTQGEKFTPIWIARPKVTDFDVKFELLFSGICHTDVHIG